MSTARSEWFAAVYSMDHRKLRTNLQKYKQSRDESGFTALHIAAMYGDLEAVKILATEEAGLLSVSGETALSLAVRNRHHKVVSYLAEMEGRILLGDGRSALIVAIDVADLDTLRMLVPYSLNSSLPTNEDAPDGPATVFQYLVSMDFHTLIPLFAENIQLTEADFLRGLEIAKGRTTKGSELCRTYLEQYKDLLLRPKCLNCNSLACKVSQLETDLKNAESLPSALKNEIVQLKAVLLRRNCSVGKCLGCKAVLTRAGPDVPCQVCSFAPGHTVRVQTDGGVSLTYEKLKEALDFALAENLSLKAKLNVDDSITGATGLDPIRALASISKRLSSEDRAGLSEENLTCLLAAVRSLVQQVKDTGGGTEESHRLLESSDLSKISLTSGTTPHSSPVNRHQPSPNAAALKGSETTEDAEMTLRSLLRALEDIRFGYPTALMRAAMENKVDQAKQLLFQANLRDKDGKTALMYAAESGHTDIVNLLLDKEACKGDNQGRTALMYAVAAKSYECAKVLFLKEAKMATNSKHRHKGTTALMVAARTNDVELVKILMDKEANLTRDDGVTALMQAAQANACDCLRLLAPKEAGRCTNDEFLYGHGYTALMFAASNGNLDSVKVLVHQEATARLADGRQAIELASDKAVINELAKHMPK
ncbi:Ankyrin repeat protein [Giardia duodenalis]|uniref:Ankyrin repeat protein n=1 Tax=Giardia intestinalis TaxID=5741 RepID=V6TIE8_GIAIN|nr:Ankyrin repeat protein [Giardia intestinalis]